MKNKTNVETFLLRIRGCVCLTAFFIFAPTAIAATIDDSAAVPAGTSARPDSDQLLAPENWNLHGQFTVVSQFHPAFNSPYQGLNSLDPGFAEKETTDLTAFAGIRLWSGAGAYLNPEIDQGFGLSDTLGMAGFPSGAAYKVGARNPYFRLPRAFVRQVIGLDGQGPPALLDDGPNQLAGTAPADNLTITVGKFSVVDIFDTNRYANNPRADFLNWSIVNSGAYDYAADAWAFTYGAAVEWTQSWWTLRSGFFALSKVPNSKDIDGTFDQFELVEEVEERHELFGRPGKFKALAFVNRGRMGKYEDALALGRETDSVPSTALVRNYDSRPGVAMNIEQELRTDLGAFARLSVNEGAQEAFDFTEINKSLAAGLSLRGQRWNRPDDTVGLATVVNGLSSAARDYFAAGGLGILIGDGRLPDYGYERIMETYYSSKIVEHLTISADFQYVLDPAYNRNRGPVSIFALRLHAEF
jgi:high affinity Mn2+ porin